MKTKIVKLGDVFSDKQLKLAKDLNEVNAICEQITEPHLAEINRITGQQNHAKWWAYALLDAINRKGN